MPEYTYNGLSTYYATTCRECAAGCGLIIRTMQGRALKVEGNPKHPLNSGKTCARGQVAVEGLYNPNRVTGPIKHKRGEALYSKEWDNLEANMKWEDAIQVVGDALKDPAGAAFLMGLSPDHLFDLVTDLTTGIGAAAPIRYGVASTFETRATLSQAAQNLFGQAGLPFFDIGNSDLVISFGANFVEPWLSQVSYNLAYSRCAGEILTGAAISSNSNRACRRQPPRLISGSRSRPGPRARSRLHSADSSPRRAAVLSLQDSNRSTRRRSPRLPA